MGGTFDPVHHGHLVAGSEVAHIFALDEVIFVPTGQPWQKEGRRVSASEDRYLMTVIATASNPRFSVSRVDIDRPGPTYTIDTLRDLRLQRGPDAEFFFITGYRLFMVLVVVAAVVLLFALLRYTRLGIRIRAGTLDLETVSALGVNVGALRSLNFAVGIFLAGLSGVLAGGQLGLEPTMGAGLLMPSFIAITLAGAW